ncbi:MAG: hypothetical protein ACI8X5_001111 [Planctomycetota bacterium]|jgi:uncharacterized protein involved in cysteine biosynthesis
MTLHATPCRLCGYDAPDLDCPHCGHESTSPSLTDKHVGWMRGMIDGLRAVPNGLFILASTKGVKRFLIPPVILTSIVFFVMFWWAMGIVDLMVEAVSIDDISSLGLEEGWFKIAVVWMLEHGIASGLARVSGFFLWFVVSSIVALYAFSVIYEALAGPFLDEIQGRIEEKWFGNNPRNALHRPTDLPVRSCVLYSLIAGVAAISLAISLWLLSPLAWWIILPIASLPFFVASVANGEYGKWLGWVIRIEGHTLWVSVKASFGVLVLLVIFLPLKFVPLIGFPLFMAIAGFATAITLLDIPFSRRGWSFLKRMQFMVHNAVPLTAFGAVSSLVFLVPIIGPIVMVPAASIGGLWLIVRLDKDSLRPQDLRKLEIKP